MYSNRNMRIKNNKRTFITVMELEFVGTTGTENPGCNPLLPLELWELIFRKLEPGSQLKRARLVCKAWNQEICRIWKNQLIIYIHGIEDLPNTPNGTKPTEKPSLREYLAEFLHANKLGVPLIQPRLNLTLAVSELDLMAQKITNFPNIVEILEGLHVKIIENNDFATLFECHPDLNEKATKFLELMLGRCQNLVTVGILQDSSLCFQGSLLVDRPSVYQQLQSLTFNNVSALLLLKVLHQEPVPPIRSLSLTSSTLTYNSGGSCLNLEPVQRLASTLTILKMTYCPGIDPEDGVGEDTLPFLPHLKTLWLERSRVRVGHTDWLKSVPKLKELIVLELDLQRLPDLKNIESYSGLRKIGASRIICESKIFHSEVFRAIRKNFPNVRSWTLALVNFDTYMLSEVNGRLGSEGVIVEELETWIPPGFPQQFIPGLKRLRLQNKFSDKGEEQCMELLAKHPLLPDLREIVFGQPSKE